MLPDDLRSTISSQYANSEKLMAVLQEISDGIDPRVNLDAFFSDVWDISTAQGWGLDVWGRIVGVGRSFTWEATTYTLSDADYRTLIFVKAMANICDDSIPGYNKILQALMPLFTPGASAFVNDLGGMHMLFVLNWDPIGDQLAILVGSGVMPRPAGVGSGLAPLPDDAIFGFDDLSWDPFDQSPFFEDIIPIT